MPAGRGMVDIRFEHAVVKRTADLNAVATQNRQVILKVVADLDQFRIGQQGLQSLTHLFPGELRRGIGSNMADRDVRRPTRCRRKRNPDQPGMVGVQPGGLSIHCKGSGLVHTCQPLVQFLQVQHRGVVFPLLPPRQKIRIVGVDFAGCPQLAQE